MATTFCEHKLADSILATCENTVTTGIREKAYIINKADIASTVINDGKMTVLTLVSGASAFYCYNTGRQAYNGTQTEMTEGASGNRFTKTVQLIVPDNGPDVSINIIDQLANGKFVVIIENDYSNATGDNVFQVYGLEKGLHATAIVDGKYSDDIEGGWQITLTEEKSKTSAIFAFLANGGSTATAETTREALEALL